MHARHLVDDLPAEHRRALIAHVNDDLTRKQIAKSVGGTPRRVLRDLTSAYSQLRLRVSDRPYQVASRMKMD